MPALKVTRTTLFNDADGDGAPAFGELLAHTIIIQNLDPAVAATGVKVNDTLTGSTLVAGTLNISPIAFNDAFTAVGNTLLEVGDAFGAAGPKTTFAGSVTSNDVDFLDDVVGGVANFVISAVGSTSALTGQTLASTVTATTQFGGTVTMATSGANRGEFTYVSAAGFEGTDTFTYTIRDNGADNILGTSDDLFSIGKVTITVTESVWYIDGSLGSGGNGTSTNPFGSIAAFNAAEQDDANDFIYIKGPAGGTEGNIVLEAGQQLYGSGATLSTGALTIASTGTNSTIKASSGTVVTLATDNVIKGVTITASTGSAIGLADGNGSVGNFVMANSSIVGVGQAVDIDQGGNLAVSLDVLSSSGAGTNMQGVQLAGTASTGAGLIQGSFTAAGGTIQVSNSHGFQIGTGGGAFGGGTIAVEYDGNVNTSLNGSAVHITGRLAGAGAIDFDGNIFQNSGASSSSSAISINTVAGGTINFDGTKTIIVSAGAVNAIEVINNTGATINFAGGALDIDFSTGTTGNAFSISQSGGSVNVSTAADIDFAGTASGRGINIGSSTGGSVNFTGGGLTITTATGTALHANNAVQGSFLNISGSGNELISAGGALIDISNLNTTGITLAASYTAAAVAGKAAVSINNLDGGTFTAGSIIVTDTTGANADGLRIGGGSTTNFNFGTLDIRSGSDDGVEITGAGNGTVTIGNLIVQAVAGQGLEIVDATNSVTVTAGNIGTTNDPALEGVLISGGTGAVSVGANITKAGSAGNVVEITGHSTGTITFSGNISASGGVDNGILIANNASGNIIFSGASKAINTSGFKAVEFTNTGATGANLSFTNGGLDIDTTTGVGLTATSTTIGAGSLTVSGSNNTILSTSATAINISNVSLGAGGVTFQSIASGNATLVTSDDPVSGIILSNTGQTGFFTVTGDGSMVSGLYDRDGSGGTIQNTIGDAVSLTSAFNVTLRKMNITKSGDDSVSSSGGGNIILSAVSIDNPTGHGWIATNITGANAFDHNSQVSNWNTINKFGVSVTNTNTNFTSFTVANAKFTNSITGAAGFDFNANGSTTGGTVKVTSSEFTLIDQNAVQINNNGSGTLRAIVEKSNFHDADATGGDGNNTLYLTNHGSGTLNFTVGGPNAADGNTFHNLARLTTLAGVIQVDAASTNVSGGVLNGSIQNNTISNSAGFVNGRRAIDIQIEANNSTQGAHTILIADNSVNNVAKQGISVTIVTVAGGDSTLNDFIIRNNNLTNVGTEGLVDSGSGIEFETNADSPNVGSNVAAKVLIQGNTVQNNNSSSVGSTLEINSRAVGGNNTSVLDVTIIGNTLTNSNALGEIMELLTSAGDGTATSKINLEINSDNVAANRNTFNGGGTVKLTSNATAGTFAIAKLPAGAQSAATVDSYVEARNNGSFTVAGNFTGHPGTVAQPSAPGFMAAAAPADSLEENSTSQNAETAADAPVEEKFVDTPLVEAEGEAPAASSGDAGSSPSAASAPDAGSPKPVVIDDGVLSQSELDFIVAAAIARWEAAGATPEQIAAMRAVAISVTDLGGLQLGASNAGSIMLDDNAAGWNWFIDSTPGDDAEFSGSGTQLVAIDKNGVAGTRIDLLTVVMHELGHQIGLSDITAAGEADELMYGTINAGERRLPGSDDAAQGGNAPVNGGLALNEITIGTIPGGQTVTITFQSTVDSYEDRYVTNLTQTTTVTGDNVTVTAADDPTNPSDTSDTITLDSLTLGNLVWLDADKDGLLDAGEAGIQGVTLTLYADTNDDLSFDAGDKPVAFIDANANGVYDAGETITSTTTTGAGGIYSFSGLAPGNYIVVVNPSNFASGGALFGKVVSATNADPNVTSDIDNNAEAVNGGVATRAIRLDFGLEPTGGDTNNTLDLAFVQPNQPPAGADATIAISEDTPRILTATDFPITDPEGNTLLEVVINSVSGGTVAVNGTASTSFPATVTAAQLAANQVVFTPTANLNGNGSASISFQVRDNGGTANSGVDTDQSANALTFNIAAVNDPISTAAPATLSVEEDSVNYAVAGLSISDVDAALAPAGVYVVTLSSTQGTLTLTTLTGLTFSAGDGTGDATMTFRGTLADINTALATTKYTPSADYHGSAQIQISATDSFGGTVATGTGAASTDSDTIAVTVTPGNQAPTVDLNGADGAGTGFASSYTEGGTAAAISDTDVLITDPDANDDITGATITITNAVAGDTLTVVGALPGSIVVDASSTATTIKLTGTGTAAQYEAAIEQITFSSTSDNPTVGGTATTRTITVVVSDGDASSAPATATVTVSDSNDAPDGTSATITATEDTFRVLTASDFGFTDPDTGDTMSAVTITGITGSGQIYYDADGTAGSGAPLAVSSLPQTYTVAELAEGRVLFKAGPDANGAATATIGFKVVDSSGATNAADPVANTLTIDVAAVNDAPVLNNLNGDSVVYNENDPRVQIDLGGNVTLADVDSANFDGGMLRVEYGHETGDRLVLANTGGVSIVSGTQVFVNDGTSNVQVGTLAVYTSGGQRGLEITLDADATPARVQQLLRAFRFDNSSDNPVPGARTFTWTLSDGDGGIATATTTVTVNALNDRPTIVGEQFVEIPGVEGQNSELPTDYKTVQQIFGASFSDAADGNADSFAGIAVQGIGEPASGVWQYYDGSAWVNFGTVSASSALTLTPDTAIRFVPTDANHAGGSGSPLYVVLIESSDTPVVNGGTADTTGQGATSRFSGGQIVATYSFAPVNDAPELSAPTSATVTFTEGDVSVALMQGVKLSDVDFPDNYAGGGLTLSVSGGAGSGGVNLRAGSSFKINPNNDGTFSLAYEIDNGGGSTTQVAFGTIAGYGTPTVTITALSQEATDERLEDLFDDFVYVIVGDNPAAGDRTVTLTFNDGGNVGSGGGLTATRTQTLSVVAVNDVPALDLNGAAAGTGSEIGYTEQDGPSTLAAGLVIADPDDTHIEGATVTITAGFQAGLDYLTINGASSDSTGPISWSYNGQTGVLTLTGSATVAAYQALLRQAGFESTSDAPGASRTVTWKVNDGSADSNLPTTTVTITATPDAAIAKPDDVTTAENQVLTGNLFADNGNGADRDPDGEAVTIALVNGEAANVGATITLASGAKLTVQADGTFSYDPNGKFDYLVSPSKAAATGAGNDHQTESFTYTLTDGNQVTVTVDVTGVDGPGDWLLGDGEDNTVTGTPANDLFVMHSGGDDTVYGLAGNDFFYFGEEMTGADRVDGGSGTDTVGLIGVYNDLVFTETSLVGVERLALYTSGSTPVSYKITTHEANVAAGEFLLVLAASLQANETLTFNGTAETDGRFIVRGGAGADMISGGARADHLMGGGGDDQLFGMGGNDTLVGGAGADQLSGGTGRNFFQFHAAADSAVAAPDEILDFHLSDKIDLSAIDANSGMDGNQAFAFIGDAAFSAAGQVRASYDSTSGVWSVEGDIDGDGKADFLILVTRSDAQPFVTSDFIL
jgi:hypothetical protein